MCLCSNDVYVCVCFKLRLSTVLLGVYACACVPSECHAISLSHRWWWWDISGERNSITCWRRSALQNDDDGSLSSDPVRYTLLQLGGWIFLTNSFCSTGMTPCNIVVCSALGFLIPKWSATDEAPPIRMAEGVKVHTTTPTQPASYWLAGVTLHTSLASDWWKCGTLDT